MSARVGVVTDSTADLPGHLLAELGVAMVPMRVHFGLESLLDHVEIEADEFYRRMATAAELPHTSQPNPGEFAQAYDELLAVAEAVVAFTLSSRLSGSFQSASLGRSLCRRPDAVTVVDSRSASLALGQGVMAAARAARAGADPAAVAAAGRAVFARQRVLFAVDTLAYLQKNGRIGRAAAWAGHLLDVKPILALEDGEVVPVDRVRGRHRVVGRLTEAAAAAVPPGSQVRAAVMHAAVPELADDLTRALEKQYTIRELTTGLIGPVIGCHAGPGTLGLAVAPLDEAEG